jgi:hypothetical protein
VIRCRVARRFVDAALERELGLEERFQLEEHTAACSACSDHERRARALQELLEGPGDPAPTAPDEETAARTVFARLDRGEGTAWRPRRSWLGIKRRALAASGVLALLLMSAFLLLRGLREPEPPMTAPDAIAEADDAPEWTPASVEVTVRSALLDSFGTTGVDEERARARFLAGSRDVARAGWPVRRFVEGFLSCPEASVALAAARCLGTLGEAGAVPALQRALGRADLADGVLDALGALGEPALVGLERALGEPELAAGALLQLCRIGGPRAAAVLERAARGARADSNPSRAALLDALTSTGPGAVACLLRLAGERSSEPDESTAILARLPLVSDAGAELVRMLEHEELPRELAYRALRFLQPAEALPWLEERCATQRERASALETLASFPDTGPFSAVLRLAQSGRVPREDLTRCLVALLERDSERAEDFTHGLVANGSASCRPWLELLIESEHQGAARALVPLVFCDALGDDDRQWAALAVGELGTADDAERLVGELGSRLTADRRCTAACLVSIHTQLGAAGVERLLAPCSPANRRRVLAAFEGGSSGAAVRVHRVARALEGALAELAATSADQKDAL